MFTGSDPGRIMDVVTQGGSIEERLVALGQVLSNILGACNTPLEHRADVTIQGDLTVTGTTHGINTSGLSYAVANATWVRATGHGSTVTAVPASDPEGSDADGEAITIYLPRFNADRDPNVYAGDIVAYVTVGDTNYAVANHLDEKIGTIKGLYHSDIPHGWQLCDGTGSTPDFVEKFLRGALAAGGGGGSDTHSHGFTGTPGTTGNQALTVSGTNAGTALTTDASGGTTGSGNAVIADHPDHTHQVGLICQAQEAVGPWCGNATTLETGGVRIGGAASTLTHSDSGHTHSIGSHTHAIGSHTHTWSGSISPDPHSHSFTPAGTIDSASNIPVYANVVWIIRVGPSGEIS